MDEQDKNVYKDVSNTIRTTIDYPPKLSLDKISYVIFFKIGTNYIKN